MIEKFIGKKEKMTNKGTDKPLLCGVLFNTQYNLSYPMFVPNFKILGEIFDEKKSLHTNTRKKQKLYTPYILRILGV